MFLVHHSYLRLQSFHADATCSSSMCKQGEADGVVISTGANIFFGRAASTTIPQVTCRRFLPRSVLSVGPLLAYLSLLKSSSSVLGSSTTITVVSATPWFSWLVEFPSLWLLSCLSPLLLVPNSLPSTRLSSLISLPSKSWLVSPFFTLTRLVLLPLTNSLLTRLPSTPMVPSPNDFMLLAAYAFHTENQDAIDASIVSALGDTSCARAGIKLLDFKPFNPVDKHT